MDAPLNRRPLRPSFVGSERLVTMRNRPAAVAQQRALSWSAKPSSMARAMRQLSGGPRPFRRLVRIASIRALICSDRNSSSDAIGGDCTVKP